MKKTTSLIILMLFFFLALDIKKPFGCGLFVDFLFLGIIFTTLYVNFGQALILSFLFGYLHDIFIFLPNHFPGMLEFPLICLLTYYSSRYFPFTEKRLYGTKINYFFIAFIIIFHIALHFIYENFFIVSLFFYYLIHSFLLAVLINYLLQKYIIRTLPK